MINKKKCPHFIFRGGHILAALHLEQNKPNNNDLYQRKQTKNEKATGELSYIIFKLSNNIKHIIIL